MMLLPFHRPSKHVVVDWMYHWKWIDLCQMSCLSVLLTFVVYLQMQPLLLIDKVRLKVMNDKVGQFENLRRIKAVFCVMYRTIKKRKEKGLDCKDATDHLSCINCLPNVMRSNLSTEIKIEDKMVSIIWSFLCLRQSILALGQIHVKAFCRIGQDLMMDERWTKLYSSALCVIRIMYAYFTLSGNWIFKL